MSLTICTCFASPDRDTNSIRIIYFAFIMLEVAIGMYFPGNVFFNFITLHQTNKMIHNIACTITNINKNYYSDVLYKIPSNS